MLKRIIKFAADTVVICFSVALAIVLKCEFNLIQAHTYLRAFAWSVAIFPTTFICAMLVIGGYKVLWNWAGLRDRYVFSLKCVAASIPFLVIHALFIGGFTASIYIYSVVLAVIFLQMLRAGYKFLYGLHRRRSAACESSAEKKRVMIIGAGSAGNMLLQSIKDDADFRDLHTVCFIDDKKEKIGGAISSIPVLGGCENIPRCAKKYSIDTIIFAIPSCPPRRRAEILNICKDTGCTVRTLASVSQLMNTVVSMRDTREVQVEDLLGREPVTLDQASISDFISGKTVLVTGGGGSIGSEICRQVASYGVGRLIIFDIYENNAYDIENELKRKYPQLELITLIGSVRDVDRLDAIFDKYRPHVVYHAAAHKHVPLMENSPNEAVKNNVFGTLNVVRAADRFGVGRFIMISTDKAVNPTNVMGATKRICEMIIQTYARRSKTGFAAVRFGNVLGSNGSVIPLFRQQIAEGGPVTVTDPDIIRYFMTIPEAVSLVLEAGVDARGGEIFVLDMGEPVKILTLAENLIRLSGYEPYKDIPIVFSGLRPGEKLYEELLMEEEGLRNTDNSLIHIGKPIELDEDRLFELLDELSCVMNDDSADIRRYISELVPTYRCCSVDCSASSDIETRSIS